MESSSAVGLFLCSAISAKEVIRSDKVVELLFRARLETAEVVFSGPKMDSLSVSFAFV